MDPISQRRPERPLDPVWLPAVAAPPVAIARAPQPEAYNVAWPNPNGNSVSDDFERPPPTPPPPLDEWLLRSDRADRYREPFFCGRVAEYEAFRRGARALAKGVVGGQTLLFQGAPGAGKSALMHECIAAVRIHSTPDEPWGAVEIEPGTLRSPSATAAAITEAVDEERSRLATSASRLRGAIEKGAQKARGTFASASRRGGGVMGVSVGGEPSKDQVARAAFRSIERVCRGVRVVVFVDEAQITPDDAMDVLDCMHRGVTGVELLPVFFGLGDTSDVLAKRGLSRPAAERLLEMSPLAESDARASLGMAFDAYKVHGRNREQWLAKLAEISQGWPQHLNRVATSAIRVAMNYDMNVDCAPLADALAAGSASKTDYYRSRCRIVPREYLGLYKRLAIQMLSAGVNSSLGEDEMRDLARAAGIETHDGYAKWLTTSLHQGLVAPSPNPSGHYCIPIPSLAGHLRDLNVGPTPMPPTTPSKKGSGAPPLP